VVLFVYTNPGQLSTYNPLLPVQTNRTTSLVHKKTIAIEDYPKSKKHSAVMA